MIEASRIDGLVDRLMVKQSDLKAMKQWLTAREQRERPQYEGVKPEGVYFPKPVVPKTTTMRMEPPPSPGASPPAKMDIPATAGYATMAGLSALPYRKTPEGLKTLGSLVGEYSIGHPLAWLSQRATPALSPLQRAFAGRGAITQGGRNIAEEALDAVTAALGKEIGTPQTKEQLRDAVTAALSKEIGTPQEQKRLRDAVTAALSKKISETPHRPPAKKQLRIQIPAAALGKEIGTPQTKEQLRVGLRAAARRAEKQPLTPRTVRLPGATARRFEQEALKTLKGFIGKKKFPTALTPPDLMRVMTQSVKGPASKRLIQAGGSAGKIVIPATAALAAVDAAFPGSVKSVVRGITPGRKQPPFPRVEPYHGQPTIMQRIMGYRPASTPAYDPHLGEWGSGGR